MMSNTKACLLAAVLVLGWVSLPSSAADADPLTDVPLFVSFFSPDFTYAIRHCAFYLFSTLRTVSPDADFLWEVLPPIDGSTDSDSFSIRSVTWMKLYWCSHDDGAVVAEVPTNASRCVFRRVPGLYDSKMISIMQGNKYLSRVDSLTSGQCTYYTTPTSDVKLTATPIDDIHATWTAEDASNIMLQSISMTANSLRHCYWRAYVSATDTSNMDFYWTAVRPLVSDTADGVSLRSVNYASMHIGMSSTGTRFEMIDCTGREADCTFVRTTDNDNWHDYMIFKHVSSGKYLAVGSTLTGDGCSWSNGKDVVPSATNDSASSYRVSSVPDYGIPTSGKISVLSNHSSKTISSILYGAFFEEINFAGEGGLYAELIRNRDFEARGRGDLGVGAKKATSNSTDFRPWEAVTLSGDATVQMDETQHPFDANPASLHIHATAASKVSLINPGFWGISCRQIVYKGSFYASASADVTVEAFLQDNQSSLVSTKYSGTVTGAWKKYTYEITGSSVVPRAEFAMTITTTGAADVYLDAVSLFPGDAVAGLFRKDVYDRLAALKPAFLRFPGGNYLEGNTLETRWDWKKTLTAWEQRPGHYNDAWGYWTNDGLGLYEYFILCEQLQTQPLMSIFTGYLLAGTYVPMNESGQYIQDAVDALEYANGATTTTYGAIRAAQGHAALFNLNLIEVGNEESLQAEYKLHYDAITAAVWNAYPDVKVVASGNWGQSMTGNPCTSGSRCDVWDEHSYLTAAQAVEKSTKYDSYTDRSQAIFVGEYAANNDGQEWAASAIAEAAFMIGFERNADIVVMASFAPLFRHTEGTQWTFDLIGFNASHNYVIPSYYIQQIFRQEQCAYTIPALFEELTAGVACVQSDGEVVLKMVNYGGNTVYTEVDLSAISSSLPPSGTAWLYQLAVPAPGFINTIDKPDAVAPTTSNISISSSFEMILPKFSFTLMRWTPPHVVSHTSGSGSGSTSGTHASGSASGAKSTSGATASETSASSHHKGSASPAAPVAPSALLSTVAVAVTALAMAVRL